MQNPSQRPTREWPLLILAVALVGSICYPLWKWTASQPFEATAWGATIERSRRMLLGPEQVACYICFVWAAMILGSRYLEVRRQRYAFKLGLLPTEEGARILPEDARPLLRKVDQLTGRKPYILANLIRMALGKYAISHSSQDASEAVRTQAEVDLGRLVTSMATVHYLAWAIPALGFLGTVRGLAMSLSMAGQMDLAIEQFLNDATKHLNVAFDCTLVALALSLPVMFFIHSVQRDEESLVIDSQQYCLEHLLNRLCDAAPAPEEPSAARPAVVARARISR
jgi:biopolymer transport protein ExbB/TolQ